nr:hypothetical protein 25 [Saccharospirillaceae bacterium]
MFFETLSAIAATVIALQLLLFRRGKRRFKRGVSVVAWLIVNCSVAFAILALTQGLPDGGAGVLVTIILWALAALTWKAKGNLVALIDAMRRPNRWIHL